MAKKQVCITVLMRPFIPVFCATASASMTQKRIRFSMRALCTSRGRWSQTSSFEYGELSRNTAPGAA